MSLLRGVFGAFRALGDARKMRELPPEEWKRLGDEALAADDLGEAVRCYEQLAHARPEDADLLEQLLRIQFRLGRYEDMAAGSERLVALRPDHADAWLLRHLALVRLESHAEALEAVDRALALTGPHATLLVNRSVPLDRLGRSQEALASVEHALKLEPEHREARANRVPLLIGQLRIREAGAAADALLREFPDDANLHVMRGITRFLLGDLPGGFADSEWRTRSFGFRDQETLQLEQPRWRGEDLAGRTIFLHGEQGFGDNIQFLRFVPEVARRAGSVLLLVPQALESLAADALPANCRLLPQHSKLPPIDFHCALMDVPGVLGTTVDTIPAAVPYLRVRPAAAKAWRERLGDGGFKVGLVWSGNPKQANDRNRSMPLGNLLPLASVEGCRFVTLQPDRRPGDQEALAQWPGVLDFGAELRDFTETAALIESLDLVITVCTSVAHLAGALGKPVWILLSYAPDWRWMLERTDSPWYPTAQLYRQGPDRGWTGVVERVREDLAARTRKAA